MKIFIFTLICGLLGHAASIPLESSSNDATDALVDDSWQTSPITAWPLHPAPLTAYTTHGLNLLTPGELAPFQAATSTKKKQHKVVESKFAEHPKPFSGINLPQLLQPQLLTPQPYFVLNNHPYLAPTPLTQFSYTYGGNQLQQQLYTPMGESALTPSHKTMASTTSKPKVKQPEPTTKRPKEHLRNKPPKLQLAPPAQTADFLHDQPLLQAVRQINSDFVVEDIMPVPGRHVFSSVNMEVLEHKPMTSSQQKSKANDVRKTPKPKTANKKSPTDSHQIKVEATGRTATSGNVPQIQFATYFLPYFSQGQQQQLQQERKKATKTAALILEPHSKAIVGNGGTAISTPISRAFLKRGVTTNVYFNPESVAIAGVGGKAHAQADLELDLIS
uniref:DUF4774 domain-containing protein n=1 Tax=Stomoxys calcitrans TaxID=35570 RepID=A0A1I8Q257_STOCA